MLQRKRIFNVSENTTFWWTTPTEEGVLHSIRTTLCPGSGPHLRLFRNTVVGALSSRTGLLLENSVGII